MADSFDLGEPAQPVQPPAKAEAYRVLARKYRPQTFDALIGQDAMVQTLGNAIKRDRLAHAFLMTGVRGVGKTSTARLIAKALNCVGPDGNGGPTISPCGQCEPCRAIAEGRHIDVIEMDAASHTGVDDVREIIEASRYAAVSARFKIYIVDEVHMLSKNAFNALLKTLEEPPAHVKFLFATTEVNKVPITVLSRCQRFDLRRITADKLAAHFADICAKEGVTAEDEALMLVARAAEGSARDGLSILDQAIAHADLEGGGVTAAAVREMLGLSDRGAVRDLLGLVLNGDGAGALASLRRQYDYGVDPQSVLRSLLETVHGITLTKVGTPPDAAQPLEERAAREEWAGALSFPALHRLWQLFLKGHDEVARAALPIEAAEMALLRAIHASTLPDPGELARQIRDGGVSATSAPVVTHQAAPAAAPVALAPPPPPAEPEPPRLPDSFVAMIDRLDDMGQLALAARMRHGARLVRYTPPEMVFSGSRPIAADTLSELIAALKTATGQNWRVTLEDVPGQPTLHEQQVAAEEAIKTAAWESDMVRAAREAFPEAELMEWPGKRSVNGA
ncbi:DNA polymerase III subunit gamma/tau [Sphingomonas parapaucimobilis]|uniref:DNA polymerase III subunit gamma/tau n=1 Tax=Sphingomonas parapaucimobilis NBRC 15100 TaxID=1219049 RepID=A0A0A1W4G4_9SPHN|nr:DNA polymerase III subunit gamma/tau [Sphingomonas parapaucimobilis]GAL99773.1 DNA polymerase III gamma and tau subunits [Sphingomonas parapaucimobilis NBRC 15100]